MSSAAYERMRGMKEIERLRALISRAYEAHLTGNIKMVKALLDEALRPTSGEVDQEQEDLWWRSIR